MTQDIDLAATAQADLAFEQLRREVSLLRRAIEGLAAERQATPDYGPTLTAMDGRLSQIGKWAGKIAETPLLRLTPETLEKEIARVAIAARQTDHDTIERANATMTAAIAGVKAVTESAWTASAQWRALLLTGGISVLVTIVLTLALAEFAGGGPRSTRPQTASAHLAPAPTAPQQATMRPHRYRHAASHRQAERT